MAQASAAAHVPWPEEVGNHPGRGRETLLSPDDFACSPHLPAEISFNPT